MSQPIKLAITMGDPGGIGPEIALKAVYHAKWPGSTRFVLIGNKNVWLKYVRQFRLPRPYAYKNIEETDNKKISIWDPVPCTAVIPDLPRIVHGKIGNPKEAEMRKKLLHWIPTCVGMTERKIPAGVYPVLCYGAGMTNKDYYSIAKWRPGKTGPSEGLVSLLWVRAAVAGCREAKFHGVVTGPICKYSIQAAGFDFPGHTEYLAFLAARKEVAMMLIGGALRVVLVTRHLPLSKVAAALTREKIFEAIALANAGLKWMGGSKKPIGVCALNPHAGDNGLLGEEEISIIAPVIKALRQKGMKIEGPIPADVIFHQAMQNKFSAVVAMYHDQGLGPLKMIAFETGINLTLGLPFVRTSPDHGTAFNIAGKGIASSSSMIAAIKLAIKLSRRPNPWKSISQGGV